PFGLGRLERIVGRPQTVRVAVIYWLSKVISIPNRLAYLPGPIALGRLERIIGRPQPVRIAVIP
ncbi:hypothetical protein, partial [Arenibacter sp. 6A1]|uniref:hypothetical protein n=1 Tax=Arenibacter sp. 6A1 TaxID=2720391 RepID=UPI00197BBEBD